PPTRHVMEDLHWLDPLSRDLLHRLLSHPAPPPQAFLLVSRPEGDPLPADHELILHPLSFPDTLKLLEMHRQRLAPHLELDIRTRRRLAHQAGGIPLYVEELLRAFVEGDPKPPARLEALIASRVDHLKVNVQNTLFLLACIGNRAPRPLVHALLKPEEQQVHLPQLMSRGFLREGRHTYRFRHDLIREVVYAQLLYRTRRRFHRRIAETMERLGMAERQPALAAHHWREGGRPDRAWPLDLQAARAALRKGDVHRARTWYDLAAREAPTPRQSRAIRMERVLSADPRVEGTPRLRSTLLELLHEARQAQDSTPEEIPRLLTALALAELSLESGTAAKKRLEEARACFPPDPSHELQLAYHLNAAAVEQQMGHYDRAEHHLTRALEAAIRSDQPDKAWTVRNRLADLLLRTGRGEEALRLLHEGLATISEEHTLLLAQYDNTLGNILKELGRVEEAEKAYRHGLRMARLSMNAELQGTLLGNLGSILEGQGRMDEARAAYEDAIALFRALGNLRGEAFMLGSLGVLDKQLGRLQEAREAFEASLRIARNLHHHMLIVRLLNSLAGIAHLEGDPERAETLYLEALQHHPIPYMRVMIHINLALLALDRNHPEKARQWLHAVRKPLRQSGGALLRGYATWGMARVLRLRGRPGCAQRLLERARRLFEACRHPMGVAFTWITEAHLRLDRGEQVDALLTVLEEEKKRLRVGPKSKLGRAMEALRRRLRFHASAPHTGANAVHAGDGDESPQPPG
ncbi:MAG: tetratricopeptide repeat protein, partial [Candidatus Hydrothermae bacterium]|nr:tetratricopeptide repeat protein [Candidatus Hydrothermae bacterium]